MKQKSEKVISFRATPETLAALERLKERWKESQSAAVVRAITRMDERLNYKKEKIGGK